jgi:type I restriction enzyme R subunit
MRDVRSRNYFEQMKGRGTRTLDHDGLRKVTPSAQSAKTHFVIVDAVGVTKSCKTASRPLITKPSVPLKDLAMGVMMGARDEDTVASLAGRLARLDKQLDEKDAARIQDKAGGTSLTEIVQSLVQAIDPDRIETRAREIVGAGEPGDSHREQARDALVGEAARVFTGPLIELIDGIRRDKEQTVDHDNLDELTRAEWSGDAAENARLMRQDFEQYLQEHRDQIEALGIYYDQPARRAEVTHAMIQALAERNCGRTAPSSRPCGSGRPTPCLDETQDRRPDLGADRPRRPDPTRHRARHQAHPLRRDRPAQLQTLDLRAPQRRRRQVQRRADGLAADDPRPPRQLISFGARRPGDDAL